MTVLECLGFIPQTNLESPGSDALETFYLQDFYISPNASSLHSGIWNFQRIHLFDRHYRTRLPHPVIGDDFHLHQYRFFNRF